jgi:hypothetical protein
MTLFVSLCYLLCPIVLLHPSQLRQYLCHPRKVQSLYPGYTAESHLCTVKTEGVPRWIPVALHVYLIALHVDL